MDSNMNISVYMKKERFMFEGVKKIYVKFLPFWENFDADDNFIVNILKERYEVIHSDTPEFLFCPISSEEQIYYKDAVKMLYTSENLCPDFNMFDYAIGFERMEYGDRYLRLPVYYLYDKSCELMEKKHISYKKMQDKFCNFIYSNGNADPVREKFFELLSSTYKKVDSGGRYKNNLPNGEPVKDKLEFQKEYKFSIAFENSAHRGYITEKIVDAFAAGTIPIYWGAPDIKDYFNEKAFINVQDYSSLEEAVEKIREIDIDDDAYRKMLAEPAYISKEVEYDVMKNKLREFLFQICNQEKEEAYRANRVFGGKFYLDRQIAQIESYHKILNFKTKVKNIVLFWKK